MNNNISDITKDWSLYEAGIKYNQSLLSIYLFSLLNQIVHLLYLINFFVDIVLLHCLLIYQFCQMFL